MIEVLNLYKSYDSQKAVSDLTFTIKDCGVYGLLGPNGAGKSTTMNIITGCLAATSGTVKINGFDIFESSVKAKANIGYLPEQPPLFHDMTPLEYLQFIASAKKIKKENRPAEIDRVMKLTNIKKVSGRLIENLSKGYRQRVGIAQAILGEPEIIILDEPTVGLDPLQIIEIRELIKKLGETHTVILSSHILSEVQAVCDKIMIISEGKLVANDTSDNLETLFSGKRCLKLSVRADECEACTAVSSIEGIETLKIEFVKDDICDIEITTDKEKDIAEQVFFAFCNIKKPILSMTAKTISLEDVFIGLTSGKGEKV